MGAVPEVLGFPKFWGTYWASPDKKVWGFILGIPIVEITIPAIIRIARLSTSSSSINVQILAYQFSHLSCRHDRAGQRIPSLFAALRPTFPKQRPCDCF